MLSKTIGLALFAVVLATTNPRGQGLPLSDPRQLLALDPAALQELLETARPPAVSAQAKMIVADSLPAEGEIIALDASSRRKLAALSPVLRAVGREGVYEVKVVDVPQAAVGIHARAIVLISGTALHLLAAEELGAAVAHEAAHEYLWGEWERSVRHGDSHRLKEIELICDAIAVFTLQRLGVDASALMNGFEKMTRYNARRLGRPVNEGNYPSLSERRRYALQVQKWIAKASAAPRAVRDR
jgi:hypothetical protein